MDISLHPVTPTASLQHGPSPSRAAQRSPAGHPPDPTENQAQAHLASKTIWCILSAYLISFSDEMNDSAPGALLPPGSLFAASINHTIRLELGHSEGYAHFMGFITLGYIAITAHPPFAVVMFAFLLLGFVMALRLRRWGVSLGRMVLVLLFSPSIATVMVTGEIRWSFFYIILLIISMVNFVFASWAFRAYGELGFRDNTQQQQQQQTLESSAVEDRRSLLKTTLQTCTTLLGALFIFAYQGAEPGTLAPGSGLGRFLLVYHSRRMGKKLAVALMIVCSVAFQLVTWLVPNIVSKAVAVAVAVVVLGLLLGPMFPALGSSGGALFPFLTGILTQKVSLGTAVLNLICLGLYAVMLVRCGELPRVEKLTRPRAEA
ncbi:hypothetical protein BDW71DRAFT_199243 [Aspergillus fruticulosus]